MTDSDFYELASAAASGDDISPAALRALGEWAMEQHQKLHGEICARRAAESALSQLTLQTAIVDVPEWRRVLVKAGLL